MSSFESCLLAIRFILPSRGRRVSGVGGGAGSMGGKSASYALSAVSALEGATAFVPSGFSAGSSHLLERLIGNGFANLLRVRAEVNSALSVNGAGVLSRGSVADALPPDSIPSVKAGKRYDRVLAEIDQD